MHEERGRGLASPDGARDLVAGPLACLADKAGRGIFNGGDAVEEPRDADELGFCTETEAER